MKANPASTVNAFAKGASSAELQEAERGFRIMLRRRFSARWISANAKDLMGQANVEYAEWVVERNNNRPARNPVGWLLTCAYRRAINLLDTETRNPRAASIDAVFHLADESTPTPEQQALDNDRQKRLREALSFLPPKEVKLLSMVYFEDLSIREAGRKLGWQKSAADRHHNAALKKLKALVGERAFLSPAPLGLAAWAAVNDRGRGALAATWDAALTPAREAIALSAEAVTFCLGRAAELWRRLAPLSDPGSATATSGGVRALGACGAGLAVVCGLAISVGGGTAVVTTNPQRVGPPAVAGPARPAALWTPGLLTPEPLTLEPAAPETSKAKSKAKAKRKAAERPRLKAARRAPKNRHSKPKAKANDTLSEPGSTGESAPAPEPAPETPEPSGSSSPPPAPAGGSGSSSAPTPPAREFGL